MDAGSDVEDGRAGGGRAAATKPGAAHAAAMVRPKRAAAVVAQQRNAALPAQYAQMEEFENAWEKFGPRAKRAAVGAGIRREDADGERGPGSELGGGLGGGGPGGGGPGSGLGGGGQGGGLGGGGQGGGLGGGGPGSGLSGGGQEGGGGRGLSGGGELKGGGLDGGGRGMGGDGVRRAAAHEVEEPIVISDDEEEERRSADVLAARMVAARVRLVEAKVKDAAERRATLLAKQALALAEARSRELREASAVDAAAKAVEAARRLEADKVSAMDALCAELHSATKEAQRAAQAVPVAAAALLHARRSHEQSQASCAAAYDLTLVTRDKQPLKRIKLTWARCDVCASDLPEEEVLTCGGNQHGVCCSCLPCYINQLPAGTLEVGCCGPASCPRPAWSWDDLQSMLAAADSALDVPAAEAVCAANAKLSQIRTEARVRAEEAGRQAAFVAAAKSSRNAYDVLAAAVDVIPCACGTGLTLPESDECAVLLCAQCATSVCGACYQARFSDGVVAHTHVRNCPFKLWVGSFYYASYGQTAKHQEEQLAVGRAHIATKMLFNNPAMKQELAIVQPSPAASSLLLALNIRVDPDGSVHPLGISSPRGLASLPRVRAALDCVALGLDAPTLGLVFDSKCVDLDASMLRAALSSVGRFRLRSHLQKMQMFVTSSDRTFKPDKKLGAALFFEHLSVLREAQAAEPGAFFSPWTNDLSPIIWDATAEDGLTSRGRRAREAAAAWRRVKEDAIAAAGAEAVEAAAAADREAFERARAQHHDGDEESEEEDGV